MNADSNAGGIPPQPADSSAGSQHNGEAAPSAAHLRLRRLPPEVGAVLLTAGIAGVLLPGPVGTPLLLAGGVALMPSVFGRLERWVATRFPTMHDEGMRHVDRFIDDLERRYPPDTPPSA